MELSVLRCGHCWLVKCHLRPGQTSVNRGLPGETNGDGFGLCGLHVNGQEGKFSTWSTPTQ